MKGLSKDKEDLLIQNMYSPEQGGYVPTGLWRGFIGVWEIIDNKLYWVDIKFKNNPQQILLETFPDNYTDGKVFADWFSSTLVIPKGEVLRWENVFERTYYN